MHISMPNYKKSLQFTELWHHSLCNVLMCAKKMEPKKEHMIVSTFCPDSNLKTILSKFMQIQQKFTEICISHHTAGTVEGNTSRKRESIGYIWLFVLILWPNCHQTRCTAACNKILAKLWSKWNVWEKPIPELHYNEKNAPDVQHRKTRLFLM